MASLAACLDVIDDLTEVLTVFFVHHLEILQAKLPLSAVLLPRIHREADVPDDISDGLRHWEQRLAFQGSCFVLSFLVLNNHLEQISDVSHSIFKGLHAASLNVEVVRALSLTRSNEQVPELTAGRQIRGECFPLYVLIFHLPVLYPVDVPHGALIAVQSVGLFRLGVWLYVIKGEALFRVLRVFTLAVLLALLNWFE